ncbi:MAG: hypothetical protein D6698_13340 [Gammaproteobacteria bacterium]|nr:MAG: hypothetical protein D6698_13340 [Gammaproteobacteria bacterium]
MLDRRPPHFRLISYWKRLSLDPPPFYLVLPIVNDGWGEEMPDNEQIRRIIASCKKCDDHADLLDSARKIVGIIQSKTHPAQKLIDAAENLLNWVADDHIGDATEFMTNIDPEDGEPETVELDADRASELYAEQEEKKNELLNQISILLTQGEE